MSLRSSVEPFTTAAGALFLLRSGDQDLEVRDAEPVDHALVAALARRPARPSELCERLDLGAGRLNEKLRALAAAGVLIELDASAAPLAPLEAERFSRQLPYLAESGQPDALQRRLRASRVVVLGCGGLGTWALAALASAGVGHFLLIDDDLVEVSNLNRQILYTASDVGAPKVDAAARWLAAFDSDIEVDGIRERIRGPGRLARLAGDADVVVMAADQPPYTLARWVNRVCIDARIPFALAGQAPPILKLGPVYWPGRSACFACHESALRDASPHYDEYVAHAQRATLRSATLGPASGMVGTALGMELLHLLTGTVPATLGAAVTVDMRTLETKREEVPRAPDCRACQHVR